LSDNIICLLIEVYSSNTQYFDKFICLFVCLFAAFDTIVLYLCSYDTLNQSLSSECNFPVTMISHMAFTARMIGPKIQWFLWLKMTKF